MFSFFSFCFHRGSIPRNFAEKANRQQAITHQAKLLPSPRKNTRSQAHTHTAPQREIYYIYFKFYSENFNAKSQEVKNKKDS